MKLFQFILFMGILFYADTNGQIVNTTALDPYLHYINITIIYHDPFLLELYQANMIIIPEYGEVLASCYLNVSRGEVNSTHYNTTGLFVVEITDFNISIFNSTYRAGQFSDGLDFGDTIVMFEFYLAQNGTFIPAAEAIEVFNRNCDTNENEWKDSFTSDSISATASFSSMQQTSISLFSSSLASTLIYTSSFQYVSSAIASVVSTSFLTTDLPSQQVSTPVTTSQTFASSVLEVSTALSVGTTSVYSTSVQSQITPPTTSITSQAIPDLTSSISQSSVPVSISSLLTASVGIPQSSLLTTQSITATQPVTADPQSTQLLAPTSSTMQSSMPAVPSSTPQIYMSSLPVSSSQPVLLSQSASSFQTTINQTSDIIVQLSSQPLQASNRAIHYSVSPSPQVSTPILTQNTSASMSLFVSSRLIIDQPSTGIFGSSLSSPIPSSLSSITMDTSSAFVPSSSIHSTQYTIQPSATSPRPLIPMSSQTKSIVSLNSTAIIYPFSSSVQQPIVPTSSSIRQPVIPTSSSIRQPAIPTSSSIRQPAIPTSSSIRQPVIPTSSSIRQPVIPTSSSIRQPAIPTSSSIRQPVIPTSSSIRQPVIPTSSSIRQPVIPTSSSIRQPVIPTSSSIRQPVIPTSSSIRQPVIPTSSSIRQPIIPLSSSIYLAISSSGIRSGIQLLTSSIVPLSTRSVETHSISSVSPGAVFQSTSMLSAVQSLVSAVSRMLTQTGILPVSSSIRVPFYSNTSTATSQFVVPTHSVPQLPSSAVFNTSQLSSTRFIHVNTSTPIPIVQSLTTQPTIIPTATPIQSTALPTTSLPAVPQVSPYRHYLITTIKYTVSSFDIGQIDDNINTTITAIASRYLNLTTQTAIAMYTLTTEHFSVRIDNITVTAIRSEYTQFLTEDVATRRVVFYISDNTAPLLATQAKTLLDTYSTEQWANSTGLQISSVTSDLYGQTQTSFLPSSTLAPAMTISPQISSSIHILNTTIITSPTTRPILTTSSIAISQSLIVSSLQSVTSSSVSIQQPLPSSSLASTRLATRSISTPVQLMTSLISVLNSTQSSQPVSRTYSQTPLAPSGIQTTLAVQPSVQVTSSVVSSVQQLTSNMTLVNSTQFLTSTGFLNASVRGMTSSSIISRITQSPIVSIMQNMSSSRANTSSIFPTQRVSLSHTLIPSSNSSLQQTLSTVQPSSTPTQPPGDYQILREFNPGVGYLLQLTLNVTETKVNISREFYVSLELNLTNLYSLALEIAERNVSSRRKRDVFNTTSQIACGIIESLTSADSHLLIIVFYISREENGLPLTVITADTSIYIFDILEPGNFTSTLGYEFLSISIYRGLFVDPHRLAIIVGTILGCCSVVLLSLLVVLCLYHCLHSNYIRADKWSPAMSITYSNKGVYTGSSTKLLDQDEFEMDFARTNFSEGTQTLARDFISGTTEFTSDSADYAFTLRTEPNLLSPFQVEETLPPIAESTTRSADELGTDKYPPPSDPATAPTLMQLRSEIEEERRRAKRAEESLLEIMTANRKHLANSSGDRALFSDTSEARRAEERANAAYEKSKKELSFTTGTHIPWYGRGSKVAPSNEPSSVLTPQPKVLDWVTEKHSVSPKSSSKSMQLSGFRNVRQPNIMQVEPSQANRPILQTPPPAYDPSPAETQVPVKPIPVRIFRTDGHPVQMHSSIPNTPATTETINVLPSFNPFYTSAKKAHTSL